MEPKVQTLLLSRLGVHAGGGGTPLGCWRVQKVRKVWRRRRRAAAVAVSPALVVVPPAQRAVMKRS